MAYKDTRPSFSKRKPKPRPSEVFDWDRALAGLDKLLKEHNK